MVLGEEIRRYRERKGLNQKQLADRANLSVAFISTIERGKNKRPSDESLQSIATALGIQVDILYDSLKPQAQPPDFCHNTEMTKAEAGRSRLATQACHVYFNCPYCGKPISFWPLQGSKGGTATSLKYTHEEYVAWGKKGGRGNKRIP